MTVISRLALSVAAVVLLPALPAVAADYDPPIIIDQAPEYVPEVPVEVGSGWYLRGDVSYNFNQPYEEGMLGIGPNRFSESTLPVSATIGFGYHFTDYLRAEANFGLLSRQTSERHFFDALNGDEILASTDNTTWSGIVAVYADLGTFSGFTPYVGAGGGLVMSNRGYEELRLAPGPSTNRLIDDGTSFSMAYTLGAGVSYAFANNMSVDLGYQYFAAPGAEYATSTGPGTYAINEGLNFHQIKLGLRYDLW